MQTTSTIRADLSKLLSQRYYEGCSLLGNDSELISWVHNEVTTKKRNYRDVLTDCMTIIEDRLKSEHRWVHYIPEKKANLREISLKSEYTLDEIRKFKNDLVVHGAMTRMCLNPFSTGKKFSSRSDPDYTLVYKPANDGFYEMRFDRRVGAPTRSDTPSSSEKIDPTFVYSEWVETEDEAIELLEFFKTAYIYKTHGLYPCENGSKWVRVELQW